MTLHRPMFPEPKPARKPMDPRLATTLQLIGSLSPRMKVSPLVRQQAEGALMESDLTLALLCSIEATACGRRDNDVDGFSKLSAIAGWARQAIAAHTGEPFTNNVLYPFKADE